MTTALHSEQTDCIHIPYAWSYANAAARTGASGFATVDIGKLARQEDTNALWMLTATAPTWVQVGGTGMDAGTLDGLDSLAFIKADGSVIGATGAAQDFGANGIKANTIAESGSTVGVTIDGVLIKDTTVDLNGTADALVLDADGDTTISAPTEDQIDIEINGADDFQFTANTLTALSGSTIKADTIAETTGDTGVTVDGVLLKDGLVDGIDVSARDHNAVSLAVSADVLLGLSTQVLALDTQVKNTVLAGPTTGVDAAPTFRVLDAADMPATYLKADGTVTGASAQAQTFTNGLIAPTWKPVADSVTALQLLTTGGVVVLNVDTTNARLGSRTVAPASTLHIAETVTTSPRGIMSSQHNNGGDGARFHMRKSRGTNAAPATVVTGDLLGRLVASGYDSANYLEMGGIDIVAVGTIAATRVPTEIRFLTATDAAPSVLTQRMVIDKAGNVGIGTTGPGAKLQVVGLTSFGKILDIRSDAGSDTAGTGQFTIGLDNPYWTFRQSATALTDLTIDRYFGGFYYEAMRIQRSSGNVGIGTTAPDRLMHAEIADAGTNAVVYAQRLSHISSGTVAANFGTGIEFELEGADGTNLVTGAIENLLTDPATGAEDADLVFKTSVAGAVASEQLRVTSAGIAKAAAGFAVAATPGLSGTLTLDDGANWRITLTFVGGILTGQTTGASSAAAATWV